jgi:putative tricarboxylic transport membrane protein
VVTRILRTISICVLAAAALPAAAQAWKPSKNVELIIALSPGSNQDRNGRTLQRVWQDKGMLPVTSSVVTKVGGNAAVAWTYLSAHPADPHYFQISSPTILTSHITGGSPYHFTTHATPVALLGSQYLVIATRTENPVRTGKDLLDKLKRDPASVSFGINSTGNNLHMLVATLGKAAGIDPKKLKIVVFAGAELNVAALGGHVDFISTAVSNVVPSVQGGRMRVIGIAAPARASGLLADAPTWKEQGVDVVSPNWLGLIGAKGLTPPQVAYWDGILAATVATDEWKAELARNFAEPDYRNSAGFTRFLQAEYGKLKAGLVELGIAKN